MPKITGTGVSPVGDSPVPPQEFDQGKFFQKEGEPPSAGNSSSPSSETSEKTPDKPRLTGAARKPARTTANRSR